MLPMKADCQSLVDLPAQLPRAKRQMHSDCWMATCSRLCTEQLVYFEEQTKGTHINKNILSSTTYLSQLDEICLFVRSKVCVSLMSHYENRYRKRFFFAMGRRLRGSRAPASSPRDKRPSQCASSPPNPHPLRPDFRGLHVGSVCLLNSFLKSRWQKHERKN